MKTIYLQNDNYDYQKHEYETNEELIALLTPRNITLGDGCELGNWCKLGNGCKLGNWCQLGNRCQLGDGCKLGDGYKLSDKFISDKSPCYIIGTKYSCGYYGDGKIWIGCKVFTPKEWFARGISQSFTEIQLVEYRLYIELMIKLYNIQDNV